MPVAGKTLAQALVAAQAEMPAVPRDGTNPHFKNRYVTLDALLAKVRPVLNKHGLAVAQFPSADSEGRPTLVTLLVHESGDRLEYTAPLLLPKADPQGQGSAITYMRRYALAACLGISDQDDDDGNASSSGREPRGTNAPSPAPQTNGSPDAGSRPATFQPPATVRQELATDEQRQKLAQLATDLETSGKVTREQLDQACRKLGYADFEIGAAALSRVEAESLIGRLDRYRVNAGAPA